MPPTMKHDYEVLTPELSRAVLSSLPSHIAVIDRAGVIIATNDAWDRFAEENGGGGTCGVGCNYLLVCGANGAGAAGGACCTDDDTAGAAARGIREVLEGRTDLFQMEYPCHAPSEERWFLLSAAPMKRAEGGAVISHVNITARKKAENALRDRAVELAQMARQLKKSNEELDQFAYITSHDLRAPLRGIANLSRWIEEDLADRVTPDARRLLDLLRGRVTRMEALIDGILEYSRIGREAGRTERTDVGTLLAEVVDLLAPPIGARVEIAPNMPTIETERLRLQQVFMNLISNALKHHDRPSQAVVKVSVREAERDFLEFSVADNGRGIEPQYHEKVFVIFQTLEARDKVESTGVGLSLVKKIVESEGGTIRIESRGEGDGAKFVFTWPKHVRRSGD
jgi:signal transduction histidine kinase